MDYSTIAVRYAKAFFSLIEEKKLLEEVQADIDLLSSLMEGEELKELLDNHTLKVVQKNTLLTNTFEGKLHPLTLNFLKMVVENGRSTHFDGICRYLQGMFHAKQNVKTVRLTTAVPMSDTITNKLVAKLEKKLASQVKLETMVDASLIGGFVLRIDNQQYDTSIQHKLQQVKNSLLQA
ncbi:MAG: ATP synthase F1 subunit delta [Mangrovibacterium sp.]